MTGRLLGAAFVFLFAVALPAQMRKPCFVSVVDGAGKPLANAQVVLRWLPGLGTPGDADRVIETTDAQGRCRPELRVGRLYKTWAIGPAASDGVCLVSAPTDRGACGCVIELTAAHAMAPRRVRVHWNDQIAGNWHSLAVLMSSPDDPWASELEEGNVLPPQRYGRSWIGVGQRELLQRFAVEPFDAAPELSLAQSPVVKLRVVREGTEPRTPIAGAEVALTWMRETDDDDAVFGPRGESGYRLMSVTNGKGEADVPLHGAGDGKRMIASLRVSAPGCSALFMPAQVAEQFARRGEPLVAALPAARVARGVWRAPRDGEVSKQVVCCALLHPNNLIVNMPLDAWFVGAETIQVDVPANAWQHQLVAHVLPRDEKQAPRLLALPVIADKLPSLPDVLPGELRTLRVQVLDATGAPACGAQVAVVSPVRKRQFGLEASHLACDAAGRVELMLGEGDWGVYACRDGAHALFVLGAGDAGRELVLKLVDTPRLRCRVVDADGRPVVDARLEVVDRRGQVPAVGEATVDFAAFEDGDDWARRSFARCVAQPLLVSARSTRDGMIAAPVQDWLPWKVTVRVRAGPRASDAFDASVARDLGDIVVK